LSAMSGDAFAEATGTPVQIRIDTSVTDADIVELWAVYDAVFHDWPDREAWRAAVWDKHAARRGFRLARAYGGGELVGFAYGYTGERGQWWADRASEVLTPPVAAAWLGGHFELVSVGVVERARSTGVGRALMRCITEGLSEERWLLMTSADESDPARGLYASEGWRVIGPGLDDGQVIMAKRKP
jgi:ribosomal protein S18 acetylase RimI-like enzyme